MINICIIATIVIYLVGMLLVGFVYSKSNEDSSDFYLGGRTMGPLVTAMSAEASDMSSWLLMGMPGLAYLTGIASPGWTAIGLAVGTWLNWLIVARRLRRYSRGKRGLKCHRAAVPGCQLAASREERPASQHGAIFAPSKGYKWFEKSESRFAFLQSGLNHRGFRRFQNLHAHVRRAHAA